MIVGLVFFMGIANFALHSAVLDSQHPMVRALPSFLRPGGFALSRLLEFAVLLAAMLLAAKGWGGAVGAYAVYTLVNLVSGWLLLTRRI